MRVRLADSYPFLYLALQLRHIPFKCSFVNLATATQAVHHRSIHRLPGAEMHADIQRKSCRQAECRRARIDSLCSSLTPEVSYPAMCRWLFTRPNQATGQSATKAKREGCACAHSCILVQPQRYGRVQCLRAKENLSAQCAVACAKQSPARTIRTVSTGQVATLKLARSLQQQGRSAVLPAHVRTFASPFAPF